MNCRTLLGGAATLLVLSPVAALAQNRDPSKLRVALLPDENAATLIQNAQPLKAYLENALKKDIELIVTTDYSSMIEAMRFGRIEIAYFGPFSYVLAKSKAHEIEPFAVGVERGSPTYNSVVVAHVGGPVTTLADIRGKDFGFGDQASTSSHLIPRALLLKNGLDAGKDYRPVHLGAHDAVARAVQNGQVPAGALSKAIFEVLLERKSIDGNKIRVIAISAPIPNYPMVMQGSLALELKERDPQGVPAVEGRRGPQILPRAGLRGDRRQGLRRAARDRENSRSRLVAVAGMNAVAGRHGEILAEERLAATKEAAVLAVVVLVCVVALWATGFFDAERLMEGAPAFAQLFREMVPPDFGRWHSWLKPLADTLAMSIAGTALAVVLSLPLALLSASNTSPHPVVYHAFRTALSALRSVPEIIMGIIFVAAVGFGALPGVLALALHSTGMVGKFYAEAIEHVDPRPIEAARAAGASPFQVITHAVLPQVLPQLADITIYRWEYHFRASTVLGIVGAGGIGFELIAALRIMKYDQVSAILLTILMCVIVVDGVGAWLRRKLK